MLVAPAAPHSESSRVDPDVDFTICAGMEREGVRACVQPYEEVQACVRTAGEFLCTFCRQAVAAQEEEAALLEENVAQGAEVVLDEPENEPQMALKVLQNVFQRCSITFFWHTKVKISCPTPENARSHSL